MSRASSKVGRAASLLLVLVLAIPTFAATPALAAGPNFSGGPIAGSAPTVVPNDHTPLAVRFSGSGLATSTVYYAKVRLTLSPDPATGGGGANHRGFVWNPTTGKWVRNRGEAWTDYPTVQTDAAGNIVSANDANWLFFKFGNENNSGTYYLNITLSKDGTDGTSNNSDTPLEVQVLDMKTGGSRLHNGAASGAADFKRVTLNAFDSSSSTNKVLSIGRTELNDIDDDSNGVVDDEDMGPAGKTGDWRLAAAAGAMVDPYIQTGILSGGDYVLGNADQDIAFGAVDQSAPTSPTAVAVDSADGKVDVSWAAASDDTSVAAYNVYRWVDVSSVEYTPPHVLVGSSETTSFQDASVTPGVEYSYEVRAVDAATNESARSSKATVEALPANPTIDVVTSPGAPNGYSGWYRSTTPGITFNTAATAMYSWDDDAPGSFASAAGPIAPPAGVHTLYYYARDDHGQVSPTGSMVVKVDAVRPTARIYTPTRSTDQSTSRTFRFVWSGSDATPGSGVAKYDVDYKVGATGSWTRWRNNTAAKSAFFTGSAGKTYYFRARARDAAGNTGAWTADDMTMVPYDNSSMKFSRGWKSVSSSSHYRGTARRTTKRGASATMTFRGGKSAYLIASTGPNRGKVRVYRDGRYIKTINLHSSTVMNRRSIYLCKLSGSRKHTIKLVAVPRTGRRYIYVDGLAVKR